MGDKMNDEFKLLGHRFDTVQFSLRVQVPDSLSETIAVAQQAARLSRKPESVELGPERTLGEVLRHGGGGGDAIFSTGELGEVWFFKLSQRNDPWGVTVKIRSFALLCFGFTEALARAWNQARGMGLNASGYSLGRIDYRFDVRTPHEFAPLEPCLIRPNRMHVRPYEIVRRGHPLFEWNEDAEVRRVLQGTHIQTLMAGKIGSGNQLVLYDKRAEQVATRKGILFEHYGLNPLEKDWGLWRVEVRYAGDVLKRRWNVRTVPALRANLQPMLHKALTRVRYVKENQEYAPTAEAVLHPLWQRACEAIQDATCDQPSEFPPERALSLLRAERERSLKANITGCALSLAAMRSQDGDAVRNLAPRLAHSVVSNALTVNPDRADAALRRAWQNRPVE